MLALKSHTADLHNNLALSFIKAAVNTSNQLNWQYQPRLELFIIKTFIDQSFIYDYQNLQTIACRRGSGRTIFLVHLRLQPNHAVVRPFAPGKID